MIEVRVITLEECSEKIALLSQIGVAKHQQETCVEEDADENAVGDVRHLGRLRAATDIVDDDNDYHSDHCIENDDEVLYEVVHNHDLPSCLLIQTANFFLLWGIINVHNIIKLCILKLCNPLLRA